MLAQDWPKSHGMTTVFKDYGTHILIMPTILPFVDCSVAVESKAKKEKKYLRIFFKKEQYAKLISTVNSD